MSDEEAREALEEVLADGLWRLYQDPNGNPGVLIHEDPRTTAHAVLSIILASGLVVTAAEHDRQVAEKAWDEGYKDRGGVVVDIYGDVTETRENPYRSTALQGIQEESKA